jgi:hypothetical protein
MMITTTTPRQARDERSTPDLPPPTVAVQKVSLRQETWYECSRSSATVKVVAPSSPPGYQSVVTSIKQPGREIRTGTELASVAGQPLLAVVTDSVLYRDLVVGSTGPDVFGFERAVEHAGVIHEAERVMSAATVAAWNARFDASGPSDRVRISTMVAVPDGSTVAAASAAIGDPVKAGDELLEVQARSGLFTCDGVNPDVDLKPSLLTLEIDGKKVRVTSVVAPDTKPGLLASIEVQPAQQVSGQSARLGVQQASSNGEVLAVPLSAVKVARGGTSVVVVVSGQKTREVTVALGVSAQGLVGVTGSGLKEGELVELFDPASTSTAADQNDNPPTESPNGN